MAKTGTVMVKLFLNYLRPSPAILNCAFLLLIRQHMPCQFFWTRLMSVILSASQSNSSKDVMLETVRVSKFKFYIIISGNTGRAALGRWNKVSLLFGLRGSGVIWVGTESNHGSSTLKTLFLLHSVARSLYGKSHFLPGWPGCWGDLLSSWTRCFTEV